MVISPYTAGLRKHPLAGFARSVYHTLTGHKIPVYLEHLNNRTVIRNKYTASEDKTAIFYPNPTLPVSDSDKVLP